MGRRLVITFESDTLSGYIVSSVLTSTFSINDILHRRAVTYVLSDTYVLARTAGSCCACGGQWYNQ